jgi:uroporphyrinogen decarboxylase
MTTSTTAAIDSSRVSDRPSLLAALAGEDTPTAPVWLMRQAGRYLPEYRALKDRYGFWTMVSTPEIAAEVTIQPLRRFPLDGAILFSDIMTPLCAAGVAIDFAPGPIISRPIRAAADVAALRLPSVDEIAPFVAEAIAAVRSSTSTPLIGFAGAPLTLATYLVEGGSGGDFAKFRAWLPSERDAATQLLELLTDVTIRYLQMQIAAGVQVVQLFDSWAGVLDQASYAHHGVPHLRRILEALEPTGVPCIYLAVGASHLLPSILDLPVQAISVDWRTDLRSVRRSVAGPALQGNLDPAILLAPPSVVADAAERVLDAGRGGAHVFNLGHGLLPDTPPDNVAVLIDTVHNFDRHPEAGGPA